ncbi:hypothetical protein FOYG_02357 [Fusarium oxysporum NRRL 32931]|uniref:Fucose-specific lectin n=1 Tax=Fusarium oxysporum NRRL 32931 TaxID=660029 RepID=W9IYD7_FUSOX|nr:hypothetical protein FOYG_02357 [Fusarium oxysporum NRRL 32931]
MPDELHLSSNPNEQRPRSSMTLMTTLDDGTTINLTVSPASTASSAVTASTTFTHNSFSFQIHTLSPNQAPPLRTVSPSPEAPCSYKQQPSDKHPKPTGINPPRSKLSSLSKMSGPQLPEDVVAIDTGEKSLLFYVSTNRNGDNQLSYLESIDSSATGDYKIVRITKAKDREAKDDEEDTPSIVVSSKNKQVAAVTWKSVDGIEIRVYYVEKGTKHLREVCKTGNNPWFIGSLSYYKNRSDKFPVRPDTSISASVYAPPSGRYSLRVFAAADNKNAPSIHVHKFKRDPDNGKERWSGEPITEGIAQY